MPRINIPFRRFMTDRKILDLGADCFKPMRTIFLGLANELEGDEEREIWREITGYDHSGITPKIAALGLGRRAGKSRFTAGKALWHATCWNYSDVTAPGEKLVIPFMAHTQEQATVDFEFIKSAAQNSKLLRDLVTRVTATTIEFETGVEIRTMVANHRSIRGINAPFAVCEEMAFWASDEDSKNLDADVIAAVNPATATTGGQIIIPSSCYARNGYFYDFVTKFEDGHKPRYIAFRAGTLTFHDTPDMREEVAHALEEDEQKNKAEYLSEWRDNESALLSLETINANVDKGVTSHPYNEALNYKAAVDVSGNSNDAHCLTIAHAENGVAIIDEQYIVNSKNVSTEELVRGMAEVCERFGVYTVHGDDYGAQWVKDAFKRENITYENVVIDEKKLPGSEILLSCLGLFSSRKIRLLDIDRTVKELASLRREVGGTNRDNVKIPKGKNSHGDCAISVCAAALLVTTGTPFDFLGTEEGQKNWERNKHILFGEAFLRGTAGSMNQMRMGVRTGY